MRVPNEGPKGSYRDRKGALKQRGPCHQHASQPSSCPLHPSAVAYTPATGGSSTWSERSRRFLDKELWLAGQRSSMLRHSNVPVP